MGSSVYSMDEALHESARNPTRATTVESHPSKNVGALIISVPFTLRKHVTAEGATLLAPAPCTNRKDKERATHHVCDV